MTPASPYVFLSYSSIDRDRALPIADVLEAHGIAVWIDRKSIPGGTSWSAEILRAIRGCTAFVVICSPAAVTSPNVQQEVQLAWENRRPILPVLLERTDLPDSVGYALAGRQWIEVLDFAPARWVPQALRALEGLGISYSSSEPVTPPLTGPDQPPSVVQPDLLGPGVALPGQLTSFIGREREVAEVKQLLTQTRLLTLIGTGGCGKTRLAFQVASELLGDYPDGVGVVELAALADPALVPQTVAFNLDVREVPQQPIFTTLVRILRPQRLLVVLDNCEHLIEACARLADALLRNCPNLQILATSREALGIGGEVSWRVPSLAVPQPEPLPPIETFLRYEGIRLFEERAAAVLLGFRVTRHNASTVAQLCYRLDGVPGGIFCGGTRVFRQD